MKRKAKAMIMRMGVYISIILVFLTLGCTNIQKVSEDVFIPVRGGGQLSLFFTPVARGNFHISFQLDSIEAVPLEGQSIILSSKVVQVNSREWLDRQIRLAEVSLPPNRYKEIDFRISKAVLDRDGEKVTLNIPDSLVRVAQPFQIFAGENTSIFIQWDVDRSIESEAFLKPVMTSHLKEPQLKSLMIYVTQERSDNVVVINRETDQIVSTIAVGKRPHGVAIQPSINRAYVANSGDDTLSLIDTQTNRVIDKVITRLGAQPEDVAVSDDGQVIVACYFGTNQVSIRDANSLRELAILTVDKGPIKVAIEPGGKKAFVSNFYSNTVSVVDTSLFRVIGVIPVESKPIGLAFNSRGDRLYVVNSGSSNVSIISPTGFNVVGTFNVGTGGYGVLADSIGENLFLTRAATNQFLFLNASVNIIRKILPMDKEPTNIDVDPDGKKIYVINKGSNSISVVNKILGTVEKRIGVGSGPYDIAIAQ